MRTLTENTQVIHATKGWYLHQIQQYRLWKATYLKCVVVHLYGLPRWHSGKESACKCGRHKRCGFNPWVRKISWRRARATHSSILAWRIPRTEKPGGLQSIGPQRVRHDWSDLACIQVFIDYPWELLTYTARHRPLIHWTHRDLVLNLWQELF